MYPPFRMLQPGRLYTAGTGYRYGYNGKENDNDVKGDGNQQDYGMRIYDPRLGRFLSVDPIAKSLPELTPYQFASNSPIEAIDIDGFEAISSKKAYIRISLQYNQELKQLTSIEVYASASSPNIPKWIAKNIRKIQENLENEATKKCNCTIVSSPDETLVANLSFEYKTPEDPVNESEMEMIERSKHLSGKSGTYIEEGPWSRPLSNAMAAQRNVQNSANPVGVNTVRLDKANAAVTGLTFLAKAIAYFIKEDQITEFNNQVNSTSGVISFLQEAVSNGVNGLTIPSKYLNNDDLTSIANYLLKGKLAYIYSKDHLGNSTQKENTELNNVSKKLLNAFNARIQKRKEEYQLKLRERNQNPVDNTHN